MPSSSDIKSQVIPTLDLNDSTSNTTHTTSSVASSASDYKQKQIESQSQQHSATPNTNSHTNNNNTSSTSQTFSMHNTTNNTTCYGGGGGGENQTAVSMMSDDDQASQSQSDYDSSVHMNLGGDDDDNNNDNNNNHNIHEDEWSQSTIHILSDASASSKTDAIEQDDDLSFENLQEHNNDSSLLSDPHSHHDDDDDEHHEHDHEHDQIYYTIQRTESASKRKRSTTPINLLVDDNTVVHNSTNTPTTEDVVVGDVAAAAVGVDSDDVGTTVLPPAQKRRASTAAMTSLHESHDDDDHNDDDRNGHITRQNDHQHTNDGLGLSLSIEESPPLRYNTPTEEEEEIDNSIIHEDDNDPITPNYAPIHIHSNNPHTTIHSPSPPSPPPPSSTSFQTHRTSTSLPSTPIRQQINMSLAAIPQYFKSPSHYNSNQNHHRNNEYISLQQRSNDVREHLRLRFEASAYEFRKKIPASLQPPLDDDYDDSDDDEVNFDFDLLRSSTKSTTSTLNNNTTTKTIKKKRKIIFIPSNHPYKITWDTFIVLLTIASAYTTHTSIRDRSYDHTLFTLSIQLCFFLDVLLNFITEHRKADGTVLRKGRHVWARYLTTWFVVDMLSLISWERMFVKPIIDRQNRRNIFVKWFFRSKAAVKVSRFLKGKHFKIFGQVANNTKQFGVGSKRLLELIIKYVPKYLLFYRNMKAVLILKILRQIHFIRKIMRGFDSSGCSSGVVGDDACCNPSYEEVDTVDSAVDENDDENEVVVVVEEEEDNDEEYDHFDHHHGNRIEEKQSDIVDDYNDDDDDDSDMDDSLRQVVLDGMRVMRCTSDIVTG